VMEGRIPESVRQELEARGHKVQVNGDWVNGAALAIRFDADSGVISGAASPRSVSYCVGW